MPEGHRADLRSTESRLDGFGSRLFEFTHIPLLLEASHAVKSANLWWSTKIDCRPTSLIRMRYVGLAQHNMLVNVCVHGGVDIVPWIEHYRLYKHEYRLCTSSFAFILTRSM